MMKFPFLAILSTLCFLFPLHAQERPNTASIKANLEPFVAKNELGGAVALVTDAEKTCSVDVVGPLQADSLFWIASETKSITATLFMLLVDEGKVALDDAVEKYLPEFRNLSVVKEKRDATVILGKPQHPITLREVLSHMSGMPFKSAVEEPTLDGLPLAAAVRSYAMTPLQTEPGTHYAYSNAGINTAARVLEVITKTPYEEFLQQRLLTPLGMKDTTFWPTEEQAARVAKSFKPDQTKTKLEETKVGQLIYPLTDKHKRFPMPAGGLFSTAEDVAAYCRLLLNKGMHQGKRLLSEAAVAELTKRQTPDKVKESYGLGFAVGPEHFGHGGAFATNLEVYPTRGCAIVWMVQHAGFVGEGGQAQGVFKKAVMERFPKLAD